MPGNRASRACTLSCLSVPCVGIPAGSPPAVRREHVLVDPELPLCSSPELPQSQAASPQPLSRAPVLFTHKCHRVELTASPERVCSTGVSPCVAGKPSPITSSWAPSGALFWPKNQIGATALARSSPGPGGAPVATLAAGRADPEVECTKMVTFNSHNGFLRLALLALFYKSGNESQESGLPKVTQ